jgi:broad specificity phosphatase PhoE
VSIRGLLEESGCQSCWRGWLACGSIGLVTVIYLVQHGDKVRGPGDPALTELGLGQAAATARWLAGAGLQALFSSPLRRARETAAAIADATGLPVQLDERLRERLNWDGTQTSDAFAADWDRSTRDRNFTLSNGESSHSAGDRMQAFVTGLCGGPGPVGAISHGGVTTDLLRTQATRRLPCAHRTGLIAPFPAPVGPGERHAVG